MNEINGMNTQESIFALPICVNDLKEGTKGNNTAKINS